MPSKSVIVGTAGHIDHGKTSLVKALTGIDADRLEEEKRRGITIDLGFAHLDLPGPPGDTYRIGFVDVPGHERFVRNMLAGVGGIDVLLLVIAADEGIKPQTREHFDICRLLSIGSGIVVLTKSDLVDPEMLEIVRSEVQEFLRGSFLERAPLVGVSSRSGAGLDELRAQLTLAAARAPSRTSDALFRLPIDRVFTMKGFGTVVTGTLISGALKKQDEVELFPAQRKLRVRGIQVHNHSADIASAGQRTAVNLGGVEKQELARGMTLAAPGLLRTSRSLDVQLTLLAGARPLKNRARVHLHAHTSEQIAEVVLHGLKSLEPGSSVFARLRLTSPELLLPGDRFIIRQFSPVVTIGGGIVLDAFPAKRTRDDLRRFLETQLSGSAQEKLLARIGRRGAAGMTQTEAVAQTGWPPVDVASVAQSLLAANQVISAAEYLLTVEAFSACKHNLLTALEGFHATHPLSAGFAREQLRETLDLAPEVFSAVCSQLQSKKKIEVSGDNLRLAGRGVHMKDEEAEAKQSIERVFANAGLKVPALKDVLASLPVDRVRAQKIVTLLLRDRVLTKLGDDLVFHQSALHHLRESVRSYKAKSPRIDVAAFKELTGVSRKYAIPLLEFLDRERITRREGDSRIIL